MGLMKYARQVGGNAPDHAVKAVKFRATFPKAESYGLHQVKEVEFKLGLGPCGRHVIDLAYAIHDDLLKITQSSRLPDDLEAPVCNHRARLHQHMLAKDRGPTIHKTLIKPEQVVKSGWWIFESTCTYPAVYETVEVPNKDILTAAELVELYNLMDYGNKAYKAWQDRLEVKTFVYKMADVHGRIESIK